jgi:hypothetical protein
MSIQNFLNIQNSPQFYSENNSNLNNIPSYSSKVHSQTNVNLTCNQNNQNFNVFSTNLKYLKLLT